MPVPAAKNMTKGAILPKELLLTVTVNSDKDHPPINIQFKIPEELAALLMSTPVTTIGLSVSTATGLIEDKSKFVDFSTL